MSNTIEKTFKWKTLEHNGVAFPPNHILKWLSIKINNEILALNNEQEEIVYAWAKKKDTHYINDSIFQKNFLSDFKKILPNRFQSTNNINEIDFSEAFRLVDEELKLKIVEKEKIQK